MKYLRMLLPWSRTMWVLAVSTLTRSIGYGIVVTISVLYFTRTVDIPAAEVGLGLSVAAVLGMVASIPAGWLADALGPRTTSIWYVILQGFALWGYSLVSGFASLLVAAGLVAVAESGSTAARGALVAAVATGADRMRARAYLRSVTNAGFSIGTVVGGFALSGDSAATYQVELVIGGVMFIAAGLALLPIPAPPAARRTAHEAKWPVLRDRPYIVIGLFNTILATNSGLLSVALPIWIAERTHAPTSVFAGLLIINAALVVLFQVRASRGAEDVSGGARAMRRSGLWLAACCVIFAFTTAQTTALTIALLVGGAVMLTIGELLYSAGSWALSFELAPEYAHGQYQGVFGLTSQLGTAITPALTTFLIIGYGWIGWTALAALLLAAGLATIPVARWAERTRPPSGRSAPEASRT